MQGLFDSHTFIWWDDSPSNLSQAVYAFCNDPQNQLFISVASLWELQIKIQLGKLQLVRPLPEVVRLQEANGVIVLPVLREHVYALNALPPIHRDPFDRMLIAQSNYTGAIMLTKDSTIPLYPVQTLW